MVTAITSMGRSGLYDWLMQRVTAVILLAYFLLLGWVLVGGVDYASWKDLYSQTWMRIFSLGALLSPGYSRLDWSVVGVLGLSDRAPDGNDREYLALSRTGVLRHRHVHVCGLGHPDLVGLLGYGCSSNTLF